MTDMPLPSSTLSLSSLLSRTTPPTSVSSIFIPSQPPSQPISPGPNSPSTHPSLSTYLISTTQPPPPPPQSTPDSIPTDGSDRESSSGSSSAIVGAVVGLLLAAGVVLALVLVLLCVLHRRKMYRVKENPVYQGQYIFRPQYIML